MRDAPAYRDADYSDKTSKTALYQRSEKGQMLESRRRPRGNDGKENCGEPNCAFVSSDVFRNCFRGKS